MPAAPQFQSAFLKTFTARGAYYDCSAPAELDTLFGKERVTAYIGFDCTAKSMHIGNLVQLMTLRRLQQAGHKPILLMGGGTTKAGDPVRQGRNAPDPHAASRSRRTSGACWAACGIC